MVFIDTNEAVLKNDSDLYHVAVQLKTKEAEHLRSKCNQATQKFDQLEFKITEMHNEIAINKEEEYKNSQIKDQIISDLSNRLSKLQLTVDDRSSVSEKKLKDILDNRHEMETFLIQALTHVKKELNQDLTGEWHENEKVLKFIFAKIKGII